MSEIKQEAQVEQTKEKATPEFDVDSEVAKALERLEAKKAEEQKNKTYSQDQVDAMVEASVAKYRQDNKHNPTTEKAISKPGTFENIGVKTDDFDQKLKTVESTTSPNFKAVRDLTIWKFLNAHYREDHQDIARAGGQADQFYNKFYGSVPYTWDKQPEMGRQKGLTGGGSGTGAEFVLPALLLPETIGSADQDEYNFVDQKVRHRMMINNPDRERKIGSVSFSKVTEIEVPSPQTPSTDFVSYTAQEFVAQGTISKVFLRDAAYASEAVQAYIREFNIAHARLKNSMLWSGDNGAPKGLLHDNDIQAVALDSGGGIDTLTIEDLETLVDSVGTETEFLGNACFACNKTIETKIANIAVGTDRYFALFPGEFKRARGTNQPGELFGYPLHIVPGLPSASQSGSGVPVLFFGDFNEVTYAYRQQMEFETSRYGSIGGVDLMASRQLGYYWWCAFTIQPRRPEAISLLHTGAELDAGYGNL